MERHYFNTQEDYNFISDYTAHQYKRGNSRDKKDEDRQRKSAGGKVKSPLLGGGDRSKLK